ncbi:MAG: RidA family protein [Spirochaetota bacterium]
MSGIHVEPGYTERAPSAIGPYSQAVRAGDTLYVSGQLPLKPDGTPVFEPVTDACAQALSNLRAIVDATEGSWQLVQVRIYLRSMSDYPAVNDVYASLVGEPFPARAVVEVAGLPKNAPIEIEGVAVRTG